ncbi:hypothetical protein GGX14DRAFT_403013 [Mycena pura]|uniref:Uncharacterized protein n=1 Tax=Mycena pura TaxID=153505 RepID=A0AAD6Y326_9AGAR|nr:hypothetical protein GGX14DRAFT_403013 [Mycena pura]
MTFVWRRALNLIRPPRTRASLASIPPAVPARAQPSAVWIPTRTQRAKRRTRARAAFVVQLDRSREPARATQRARALKQLLWRRAKRRAGGPVAANADASVAHECRLGVSADNYPPPRVVRVVFRIWRRAHGAPKDSARRLWVGAECPRQWQVHPFRRAFAADLCPARYPSKRPGPRAGASLGAVQVQKTPCTCNSGQLDDERERDCLGNPDCLSAPHQLIKQAISGHA